MTAALNFTSNETHANYSKRQGEGRIKKKKKGSIHYFLAIEIFTSKKDQFVFLRVSREGAVQPAKERGMAKTEA